MTASLSPTPVRRFVDNNGFPLFFGMLGTFVAGTNTPQATYVDSTQTTPNANPIVLNFRGECNLWLDPTKAYKFVLKDAFGILIWTIDNITIGNANPSFSIIPTVDNLFTLGSPTFSFANLYLGANHAPVLGASGNVGYYVRTAAESALSVTPTDFSYPADPYIDPRRYGADPTGATDSTTAVQTALNIALQASGALWIGNNCTYLTSALSLTLTGTKSIRILGSSTLGSKLQAAAGLATPLLTLKSSTPATVLVGAYAQLESFTLQGPVAGIASGCHGLSAQGLSRFQVSALRVAVFDRGLDIQNCLTLLIDRQTEISLNNTGIKSTLVGTIFTANLWRIHDCQIGLNNLYGIDYNQGTSLYVSQCDMENNGTSATFTSAPLIGATSGTLSAPWPLTTGAYACYFPDGETRSITLTKGATTATWTGGLSAGQTQAWLGTPTGAINIGPLCSPDFLDGDIVLERNWFEGNFGGWCVNHQAQTNGNHQRLKVASCEFISTANGQCLFVGGAQLLHLSDLDAEAGGANPDTFNLTAATAFLSNIFISSLVDSGITIPWYVNVATATLSTRLTNGRYDTFTGTLTGFATPPTASIQVVQQGLEITLCLPDFTGTPSNSTGCSIMGIPAKYQINVPGGLKFLPVIVENNSVDNIQMGSMTNGSGTLTLYQGGSAAGFTAAGSKGVRKQDVKYRLDL